MAFCLKDKVALVTGGANGIGAAIVALFLEQGAKVGSVDYADQTSAESESRINLKCNVASESEVEKAVSTVVDKFGQLDVLVNCAGVMDGFERAGNVSNKTWERVMSINMTGPMYTMRCAMPHLLKVKGNIINICSAASISGASAGLAYTASKHGLLGMTRQTAYSMGKEGVRCNAILPGGVETEIMKNSNVEWDQAGLEAITPYHKCMVGTLKPEQVAQVAVTLATNEAVSGAEVTVDRGWTAA